MLRVSCSGINFRLKQLPNIPQQEKQTFSEGMFDKFLFRGYPSGHDPTKVTPNNQPVSVEVLQGGHRFLKGLTLDIFHAVGNSNVELRLYSDAVYPQGQGHSGCHYCGNSVQNRVRLQDIRDVVISTYFESHGVTSAIFSVRGDPSNCPVPSPLCPCNNAKFCLRGVLCPLHVFEGFIQSDKTDQFVSCWFASIDFSTEPHIRKAQDFEKSEDVLESIMSKKRKHTDDMDFSIVCGYTGKEFPCHKFVLSAHSDVVIAMFTSGMREAEEDKVTLSNVQEATIEALLDYMYRGQLQIPFSRVDISFELLGVAHQYEIKPLVEKLVEMLETTEFDRVPISVAIKIFSFCIKLEELDKFKNLADIAVAIIKGYAAGLEEDADFQYLFKEDPTLARQLFVRVCST